MTHLAHQSTTSNVPTGEAGIELARFSRGDRDDREREMLLLSVREYQGRQFVDLRVHYRADDGSFRPTKKGVTLRASELADARAALDRALDVISGGPR